MPLSAKASLNIRVDNIDMRTLYLLLLLLLGAPATAWAQPKSQQVERYLGKFRYENDRPKGTVKFIFQKAVYKRTGNGKKTYKALLPAAPNYTDEDNAGRLIGIQVVTKDKTVTILPEAPDKPGEPEVAESPAEPTVPIITRPETPRRSEPQPESAPRPQQPAPQGPSTQGPSTSQPDPVRPTVNISPQVIPDSAQVAKSLEEAKENVSAWQARMWATIRPVWAFVMWIFNSVIILLICFGGLCRYVAKTAASESLINVYGRIIVGRWIVSVHQNAAAMLLIITWIIAVVLLIDVFMWLVYLDLPIWTLLIIWFPILWVAEKLTSWIVPNVPIIGK